jgi:hypothetical protein
LANDVNTICEGDGKKTSGLLKYFLLGIITLGIYNLVWLYKLANRLQNNAQKYNLTFKESGGAVLLWYIFGSLIIVGPFIAMHIIIKNTNALAKEYNKKAQASSEPENTNVANHQQSHVKTWQDVLKENGLDQYISVFEKQNLTDIDTILSLTEQDLEKIGVEILGDRKRLIRFLHQN